MIPVIQNISILANENTALIGESKECQGGGIELWPTGDPELDIRHLLRGRSLFDACFQACYSKPNCHVFKIGCDIALGSCVMETLSDGRTTCTKEDGSDNTRPTPLYDLYQIKRQIVTDLIITPYSLKALWTFDDGIGKRSN